MCGRYTLVRRNRIIEIVPNVTVKVDIGREVARFNIAPSQKVLAVTNRASPTIELLQWGLIPHWAKDAKIGNTLINARAETVAEKPAFKTALAQRRCLIFADGFFEWKKEDNGKTKTPMYIQMKDGDVFAFAGLWDTWRNPEGEEISTCTIITTTPNDLVRDIHDRMPAIIPRAAYLDWLNPQHSSPAPLVDLLRPYPASEMVAFPVRKIVNSPRNEGPDLIVPATAPKQSELF